MEHIFSLIHPYNGGKFFLLTYCLGVIGGSYPSYNAKLMIFDS